VTFDETARIVNELLEVNDSFRTGDLARKLRISRQAAHRRLAPLVAAGRLVREGKGRATRYRQPGSRPLRVRLPRRGLEEDRVWDDVAKQSFSGAAPDARDILQYAFTELVNNAIEHSEAQTVEILVPAETPGWVFEVRDDGVGIFEHIRQRMGLNSHLEALQELSKGKVTTRPERHTGEGIFFVSKAAGFFLIDSEGLAWKVDNRRGDFAVADVVARTGTRVRFELDRNPARRLEEIFAEYTDEFEFSRTRIRVELFEIGVRFVSRSEGKRLMHGLERFREVILDFTGVEGVGQGFADEVFRVWSRDYPHVALVPENMTGAVRFMIERARRAGQENH
jgi:anti-sigma regulatory factor (Ser/Thr protein kinase)